MFRQPDLGLDLGNSKFSLCAKGEGVIASESAYLAYRGDFLTEASVIAAGDEAKRMYERAHPGITVTTPMSEGVIIDCHAASILVNRLARNAGIRKRLAKPRVVVGALYGASDLERKAFVNVAESIGCRRSFVIHEPLAAAIGAAIDVQGSYANMILDVGDGATEALVMSQKKTILGSSMRFGGSDIDELIVDKMRRKHGIRISISEARRIKESASDGANSRISVKGVSNEDRLPCERSVPLADVFDVFEHFADKVVGFALTLLARVPPEVSVDLIESGIFLCGGASRSLLVHKKLETATGLKVRWVDAPDQAVISGICKTLDFTKYFMTA